MHIISTFVLRYKEVTGGFDLLPKAFLDVLNDSILLNSKVKCIAHSDKGVIVSYQTGQQSSFTDLHADVVLVTTTAKAALFIDFVPPPLHQKDGGTEGSSLR